MEDESYTLNIHCNIEIKILLLGIYIKSSFVIAG